MDKQWSNFRLRINIDTTISKAYWSWSTRQGLESWFLRRAIFRDSAGRIREKNEPLEAGYTYEWYWHGYPDTVKETGKVLTANGTDRFGFTFSMGCPVSISIYREADETIVELIESDLPADEGTALKHFVGDSRGWIFYLTNLKSILEGGLDLRNKNVQLKDVITA